MAEDAASVTRSTAADLAALAYLVDHTTEQAWKEPDIVTDACFGTNVPVPDDLTQRIAHATATVAKSLHLLSGGKVDGE